ncbi:MAG: hypothetical protein LBM96_05950 [Methanobrevibacter sp.]|jgi:hypothetical protein|nr:hypothetical protein [Candidatus Methanoflexus mossambicus]
MNNKIKNSTAISYNNINFKSKLELSCYKKAEMRGIKLLYEKEKIVLMKSFYLDNNSTIFYSSIKKNLEQNNRKLLDLTYTLDFTFSIKKYKFFIDTKGFPNDTYPIKKKLFLEKLNSHEYIIKKNNLYITIKKNKKIYIFFEPHSVKEINQMLDIIEKLKNNENTN